MKSCITSLTIDEFFKQIKKWEYIPGDLVVRIAYKYEWEKDFNKSNEVLEYNGDKDDWTWLNDWDEGYDYVMVLGFIPVEDISLFSMWSPGVEVKR